MAPKGLGKMVSLVDRVTRIYRSSLCLNSNLIRTEAISCFKYSTTSNNFRLWSVVNFLKCNACQEVFPLSHYNCCRYHPEMPVLDNSEDGSRAMSYPCCGQHTFLFEPISSKSGCCYKDHEFKVSLENETNDKGLGSSDVFNELLSVVGLVCEDRVPSQDISSYSLEVMMKTELSRLNKYVSIVNKEDSSNRRDKKPPPSQRHPPMTTLSTTRNKGQFPLRKNKTSKSDSVEEDTSDLDEPGIVRIVIQHKDTPPWGRIAAKTWNSELPVRLNQDLQRESDVRRMNELVRKLALVRHPSTVKQTGQLSNGVDRPELADGGLYCRIESKLKSRLAQNASMQHINSTTNTTHSRHPKHR